jgi:hypothetical protein
MVIYGQSLCTVIRTENFDRLVLHSIDDNIRMQPKDSLPRAFDASPRGRDAGSLEVLRNPPEVPARLLGADGLSFLNMLYDPI